MYLKGGEHLKKGIITAIVGFILVGVATLYVYTNHLAEDKDKAELH